MSDDTNDKPVTTSLRAGPQQLGDPNDRSLRKVEIEVKIPQIMRERAHNEKCNEVAKAFYECAGQNGLAVVVKCRAENNVMKECLNHWYSDEDFRQECKEIYLQRRSEFRRTGKPVQKYTRHGLKIREEKES